jgi:hypothetical protein
MGDPFQDISIEKGCIVINHSVVAVIGGLIHIGIVSKMMTGI